MAQKYSKEEQRNRAKEGNAIGSGILGGSVAGWVAFVARLRKHYATFFDSITPENIVGPLDDLISKHNSTPPSEIPIINKYGDEISKLFAQGNNTIKNMQWQGFQEQRHRSFLSEFDPMASSSAIPLPNRWKWITPENQKNVVFVAATAAVAMGAICYGITKFLGGKNEQKDLPSNSVSR